MLTGKAVQAGNNVSHAMNHTRRRFLPNLQVARLRSDLLREAVRLRITPAALRTVDHAGGLDAYLLNTNNHKLPIEAQRLKRRITQAQARQEATS